MTYLIDRPIDQVWAFKRDVKNPIHGTAPTVFNYQVLSDSANEAITQNAYLAFPKKLFQWRYRFNPTTPTIDYDLVNAEVVGQVFNFGRIELEAVGEKTRVTQIGYLDFPGISFWMADLSVNGMNALLIQLANWEQVVVGSLQSSRQVASAPLDEPSISEQTKPFQSRGRYYALVIGIDHYQHFPSLESAVWDAKAVKTMLETAFQFEVTLLTDVTRSDILTKINHYRSRLTEEDHLLIYYAGHGWLDEETQEGYWLPTDAVSDNPANWIANADITRAFRVIPAKHILLVADSCYSGRLTRGLKITLRGNNYLNKIATKKSRTVMTSGGIEPVLDAGGKNNHSVFASAFLEALSETEQAVDAAIVFTKVRQKVLLNADQMPEYGNIRKAGHDGGDFIFVKRP